MQLYRNLPFGSASLLSTQFAPCYSQSCHEPPPPQIILPMQLAAISYRAEVAAGAGERTNARVLCVLFLFQPLYNRQISSKITFALAVQQQGWTRKKARRRRP
jgi:hypothetical protein